MCWCLVQLNSCPRTSPPGTSDSSSNSMDLKKTRGRSGLYFDVRFCWRKKRNPWCIFLWHLLFLQPSQTVRPCSNDTRHNLWGSCWRWDEMARNTLKLQSIFSDLIHHWLNWKNCGDHNILILHLYSTTQKWETLMSNTKTIVGWTDFTRQSSTRIGWEKLLALSGHNS